MNELDQFPYLRSIGQQFDALAEHDAQRSPRRRHGVFANARLRLWTTGRLAPAARLATIVGLIIALAGGAVSVPATRAAVSDVYSAFSGWLSGDESAAPGRAVTPGEVVPSWVRAENGQKRVLAETDGQKLVAIRQGNKLTLALDDYGTTSTIDDAGQSISRQQIMVVGPGRFLPNGDHDMRPLFGLTVGAIERIQFNYADGVRPVSESGLTGAFAITIQANRQPDSLTGYDRAGNVIARLNLVTDPHELRPGQTFGDFRYCLAVATGCSPWSK
jgi:hypothetical protein